MLQYNFKKALVTTKANIMHLDIITYVNRHMSCSNDVFL